MLTVKLIIENASRAPITRANGGLDERGLVEIFQHPLATGMTGEITITSMEDTMHASMTCISTLGDVAIGIVLGTGDPIVRLVPDRCFETTVEPRQGADGLAYDIRIADSS